MRHSPLPVLLALLLLFPACNSGGEEIPEPSVERDLAEIRQRDTLVALTSYNSTSYFLYRGRPMGFEYELLQQAANDLDLELKMVVVNDRDSLYARLNTGEGDVVAARLLPAVSDTPFVSFTSRLYETPPVVVQQETAEDDADVPAVTDSLMDAPLPDSFESVQQNGSDSITLRARLIERPEELTGERVYLPGESGLEAPLIEIEDSTSGDIEVVEVEGDVTSEALIRRVARGEIKLTASHENLAKLKESYFSNVVVLPTLGEPRKVAWAVRKNAPALLDTLSQWITDQRGTASFEQLYAQYFVDRRGYEERLDDEYLTSETGKLSPYDGLLKSYSDSLGWDWRLLAAQTYQESKFKPRARSWAGAMGLLQLMPGTARQYGVSSPYDPEDNVRGATDFIDWLRDYWEDKIPDEQERMKFILASYNTGHGHVQDARRLAQKNGDSDVEWESVAYWLLQKSKRSVYEDPVVKYGYARGLEPVTYVKKILNRFEHYRQFVTLDAPDTETASSRTTRPSLRPAAGGTR